METEATPMPPKRKGKSGKKSTVEIPETVPIRSIIGPNEPLGPEFEDPRVLKAVTVDGVPETTHLTTLHNQWKKFMQRYNTNEPGHTKKDSPLYWILLMTSEIQKAAGQIEIIGKVLENRDNGPGKNYWTLTKGFLQELSPLYNLHYRYFRSGAQVPGLTNDDPEKMFPNIPRFPPGKVTSRYAANLEGLERDLQKVREEKDQEEQATWQFLRQKPGKNKGERITLKIEHDVPPRMLEDDIEYLGIIVAYLKLFKTEMSAAGGELMTISDPFFVDTWVIYKTVLNNLDNFMTIMEDKRVIYNEWQKGKPLGGRPNLYTRIGRPWGRWNRIDLGLEQYYMAKYSPWVVTPYRFKNAEEAEKALNQVPTARLASDLEQMMASIVYYMLPFAVECFGDEASALHEFGKAYGLPLQDYFAIPRASKWMISAELLAAAPEWTEIGRSGLITNAYTFQRYKEDLEQLLDFAKIREQQENEEKQKAANFWNNIDDEGSYPGETKMASGTSDQVSPDMQKNLEETKNDEGDGDEIGAQQVAQLLQRMLGSKNVSVAKFSSGADFLNSLEKTQGKTVHEAIEAKKEDLTGGQAKPMIKLQKIPTSERQEPGWRDASAGEPISTPLGFESTTNFQRISQQLRDVLGPNVPVIPVNSVAEFQAILDEGRKQLASGGSEAATVEPSFDAAENTKTIEEPTFLTEVPETDELVSSNVNDERTAQKDNSDSAEILEEDDRFPASLIDMPDFLENQGGDISKQQIESQSLGEEAREPYLVLDRDLVFDDAGDQGDEERVRGSELTLDFDNSRNETPTPVIQEISAQESIQREPRGEGFDIARDIPKALEKISEELILNEPLLEKQEQPVNEELMNPPDTPIPEWMFLRPFQPPDTLGRLSAFSDRATMFPPGLQRSGNDQERDVPLLPWPPERARSAITALQDYSLGDLRLPPGLEGPRGHECEQ